jgi:alpha-L-rhamnosidase
MDSIEGKNKTTRRNLRLWNPIRFLILCLLLLFLRLGTVSSGFSKAESAFLKRLAFPLTSRFEVMRKDAIPQPGTTIFFPMAMQPDRFSRIGDPIWSHNQKPDGHEVSLFRHRFTLSETIAEAELHIFADTRYELWVDGEWLGRGPARFTRGYHEYDVYQMNGLQEGEHLLAIMVQWAPNQRRSESSTPFLQAHLQTGEGDNYSTLTRTDLTWRVLRTSAWRPDAVPVHQWGLIGPTELMDFQGFPGNWMSLDYNDRYWASPILKDPLREDYQAYQVPRLDYSVVSQEVIDQVVMMPVEVEAAGGVVYAPRSIPPLVTETMTTTVVDAGLLSPGREIVELVPPVPDPYRIVFQVTDGTTFTLETLSGENPPLTGTVWLDKGDLEWFTTGEDRPDVYTASVNLAPGKHEVRISSIPNEGFTFAMSISGVQFDKIPFLWGPHAGRRLLLAEPVSQPDAVEVTYGNSMDIRFDKPPAYLVLDLGRTVHGRLSARVTGPSGTVLDIGWDERLLGDTLRPLPYPGSLHSQWNQVDSWLLDGNPRALTTLDARSGRYILIAVWGEGPVTLNDLRVNEERYPLTLVGSFSSSDARLDEIWQVGVETAYPNMTDAYADPWRERGQWWGDAYVVDQVNQIVFADSALVRRGLYLMGKAFVGGKPNAMAPNGQNVHMLDYGMLWVYSMQECLQHSGDYQIAEDLYPTLVQFIQYLADMENPTSGLLDVPMGDWAETVYLDPRADSNRHGQSTAVNALYYETLLRAAQIAEEIGRTSTAEIWRDKANSLGDLINSHLFLPEENRYLTTIFRGKPVAPSPHAQAWPLAYGLAGEKEQEVVDSLLGLLSSDPADPNLDIYGMYWVLKALGRSGRITEAIEIIKTYYGWMLDRGAATWWEGFRADQHYTASLSHGWGSSPTWFLTTYVLGAQRTGPNTWLVRSAFEGVQQASGALPLQNGLLEVEWFTSHCHENRVVVKSPSGSSGEVVVSPDYSMTKITLNGQPLWQEGVSLVPGVEAQDDGIHIPVEVGTWEVVCYYSCLPEIQVED